MSDAEDWINSMHVETGLLERLKTWNLVEVPAGRKVIRSKWVFDLKRDAKGNFTRHKKTLVAKGFSQIPGPDVIDVFSPVCKYATVRLMFVFRCTLVGCDLQ